MPKVFNLPSPRIPWRLFYLYQCLKSDCSFLVCPPSRRQPTPTTATSLCGRNFEGLRALSECKLAGIKIHKPGKDETPSLSDPGPLNIRCPHPHKEQPTEPGCRIVKPNRKKEDHGKDRMYRGAELAAAPRTGGTPLRPCPTSGTSFDATAGRRVIGQ